MSKRSLELLLPQLKQSITALSEAMKAISDDKKKVMSSAKDGSRHYYEARKASLTLSRVALKQAISGVQQAWNQQKFGSLKKEKEDFLAIIQKPCVEALSPLLASYELTAHIAYEALGESLNVWRIKANRCKFALDRLRVPLRVLRYSLQAWSFYKECFPDYEEKENFNSGARSVYRVRVEEAGKKIQRYLSEKTKGAANRESLKPAEEIRGHFGRPQEDMNQLARDMASQVDPQTAEDNFAAFTQEIAVCNSKLRAYSPGISRVKLEELLSILGKQSSLAVAYAFAHLAPARLESQGKEYLDKWSSRLLDSLLELASVYKEQRDANEPVRQKIETKGFISYDFLSLMRDDFEALLKEDVRVFSHGGKIKILRQHFANSLGDIQFESAKKSGKEAQRKDFWKAVQNGVFVDISLDDPTGPQHLIQVQAEPLPTTDPELVEGEVVGEELAVAAGTRKPKLNQRDLPKSKESQGGIPPREIIAWSLAAAFGAGSIATLLGVGLSNSGIAFSAALIGNLGVSVGVFLPLLLLSLASAAVAFVPLFKRHKGWCLSSTSVSPPQQPEKSFS